MLRFISLLAFTALLSMGVAAAQDPLANLVNIVPNGGFENGTTGWRVTIGPWGRGADPWSRAKSIAEISKDGAFAGKACLRLNARRQPNEVDVSSAPLAVEEGKAYLLKSRVRQLAGEGGYKVVLDWVDAAGKHLEFSNDWRGNDHPKGFGFHGGVFTAPKRAARVVVLLGVAKGVECQFDDIALMQLPESPGQPVADGEGSLETKLPRTIKAGAFGTFQMIYRAGPHGLPIGASVEFRRSNINPRWSPPQVVDPKAPGYVAAKASNGALCMVQPGAANMVPCATRVTLVYPPLAPGDTITMIYGDKSGGGPGARAQPESESDIHFIVGMDANADDRALDLPDSPRFDVVPGSFARIGLIAPAVAEAGRSFNAILEARDRLSNPLASFTGAVSLRTDDNDETRMHARSGSNLNGRLPTPVVFNSPGLHRLTATSAGISAYRMILVTPSARVPDTGETTRARARRVGSLVVLENQNVRLLLPETVFGYGAGFLEAKSPDGWKRVGAIRSFGELRTGKKGEKTETTPLWMKSAKLSGEGNAARVLLAGQVHAGGTNWRASVECSLDAANRHVTIRSTVTPNGRASLRAFYAPVLLAGDGSFGIKKTDALFPGLEYLTANEKSSADYGSIPPLSERSVPHPFKVTMPLMAVTGNNVCAMLFWDPLQAWDGKHRYPAARFESPERRNDQDNQLFGVFAPTYFQGLPENANETPKPIVVEPGRPLSLAVSAAALAPAPDVTSAVLYWFQVHGVPDTPPAPRSWSDEKEMIVKSLLGPAWDPEKKGWHNALADPWGAAYNADDALVLWYYARENPRSPLKPEIDEHLKRAWSVVGGPSGFDIAFHLGDAAVALSGLQTSGENQAYGMTSEGAYAYHPHTGNKTFTQGVAKSIGKDGDINVGTCVMSLEPLLRAAYMTGDPQLIQAGGKGLTYINRFTRPQGAENWEVPLACPNLRAAALALRCYLYGYLLTGKPEYLAKARYWARTGLPFIYAWNAFDCPIMRYASISVMGTSIYTGGWFGNAVQWVGLVYADAIREFAPYDNDFPWTKVADGILISAMQQQKTEKAPCGHFGMFPDSYSPVKGDETYHWCLPPQAIGNLVNAMHGLDARPDVAVVRVAGNTIHVVGAGKISDAGFDAGTLRFETHYLKDQPREVVIARIEKADEIFVDGRALPLSALSDERTPGWQTTPFGSLRLRLVGDASVEVRGCVLTTPEPVRDVTVISNGGFESGLLQWMPDHPESTRIVADAHSGSMALELDASAALNEVQCTSRPMRVEAGKTYELIAWVKQTAGSGDYKVTIDWGGNGGHLAYSNDWQGTNHPAQYELHGGRFTAPAGADTATVILGVRAGARCLFDDVSLLPAL